MKNLFLLFLSILILIGGNSCDHKKVYRIAVSQCSSDDWRDKMNEEIMREAMLHDDIEVEIRSAEDNSLKQIEDIKYFMDSGFDVLVISPNEAETLTPIVRQVYEKGLPVIIFDRNINDSSYTQHIGVNNVGLGLSAGEYASMLKKDQLKAIEIYGLPSSTPAIERSKGFHEYINENGGEILASVPADWLQEKARVVTDSLLRIYPETNLIFAHNDRMAIGARQSAGLLGRYDIKIIGIDAAPQIGLKAVADKVIDATFLYPTDGDMILREAIKVAKGEPVAREILLPNTSAVDSSNADILLLQNQMLEEDTRKVVTLKDQLDNYVSLHNAQTALVYAFIAILILLFGVLFLVLRTFWAHRRHQTALTEQNRLLQEERDKQKELNEKLQEATQSKLIFFTNVSHDLRTPLTLIAEPVSQLNHADNLDPQQKTLMRIADKNVKILGRLINQILDFRKFENNKLTLNLVETDFDAVIKDWLESFYALAKKRDIKLVLKSPEKPVRIAIDPEKIERVFFNLVYNAMKYSPDNSHITISYEVEGENLVVRVADEGQGISRENIRHIFDRFYQVDTIRPQGSGIGLSLAKALVELHGGTITVESEENKGSVFTVTLPVRHVAESASSYSKNITKEDVEAVLEPIEADREFTDDKPLMLVIDDNKDIRELVTELMQDTYNVVTAQNGKEGIRKATKYVPDLIVCDVMMPGMDGMECCTALKSDTITSHIPVLMLTACSLDEQKVTGFESGADGYISKPFSSDVLRAQAASLIANRKRILDALNTKTGSHLKSEDEKKEETKLIFHSGDIDNDFYNRFIDLFEQKMSDPDLNVEAMAGELGFERTQLYRKIKAITNYSPVELMRNLRLKKARHLIKTSDKSVSEICYEVGFSTPAYFTKCYRQQYGETPSETRNKVS